MLKKTSLFDTISFLTNHIKITSRSVNGCFELFMLDCVIPLESSLVFA